MNGTKCSGLPEHGVKGALNGWQKLSQLMQAVHL